MKKPKHTPEPWHKHAGVLGGYYCLWQSTRPRGQEILNPTPIATSMTEVDADRVLSCVNACRGIQNPDAIKDVIMWAQDLVEYTNGYRLGADGSDGRNLLIKALAELNGK